jgi:shikimate kinase
VFLVGFMASGKSIVGKELAHRLGWAFVDLDSRIEAREQESISQIFRDQGETGFRRAETAALEELIRGLELDSVVALGGGAFAQGSNRKLLQGWPTVFVSAPPDELWRRSQEDGTERPLAKNQEQFARLYAERLPSYRQATITVETTGKDPSVVAAEIEGALGSALAANPGRHDVFRSVHTSSNRGDSK